MANEKSFDLIVIGGGPAGYVAAIRAAQLGLKTACVEKRKKLGGTCLNVGCIPSKALLDSSEHFHYAKSRLQRHGIQVADVKLDLDAMMKRKDEVVKANVNGIDFLFKKNKVERFEGLGELQKPEGGKHRVKVKGENSEETISAAKVLLATGSIETELPFLPFDRERIISSTEALSLNEVPKHLIVIGGGVIGLELGSVWLRLGAKVTVVEYMDRLVPSSDVQMSKELLKSLTKQGIEFKLSTKCLGAERKGNSITVRIEEGGKESQLEGDYVLVATGRKPYTQGLGLENVDVKTDERGRVPVQDDFQTSTQGLYAVGDLIQGPMLAHKAEEDGIAAVEIMAGKYGHVDYNKVPNVVYTWPELASVGKTEEQLKEEGVPYKSGSFPFMANGRARAMDETEGLVKVLAHKDSDTVLGVHILGPRASELIAEAVAVMEFGGSSEDIARTCHAHPTLAESIKEAALAVDKRAIHI